jgi:hypothetical protein
MQTNNLPRGRKPEWIVNIGKSFAALSWAATTRDVALVQAIKADLAPKATLKLQTMKIERKGKVNWRDLFPDQLEASGLVCVLPILGQLERSTNARSRGYLK